MKTIQITRDIDFSKIEHLLAAINSSGDRTQIRVPSSLKDAGVMGMEAHLLQLFATWFRRNEGGAVLQTYEEALAFQHGKSKLCEHVYGLCMLAMSTTVVDKQKFTIDKPEIVRCISAVDEKLRARNFRGAFKGLYVGLPCITTPDYDNLNGNPLYDGGEPLDTTGFQNILTDLINVVVPQKSRRVLISSITQGHIAEILLELFTNTYKHARHDYKKDFLAHNYSCITLSTSDMSLSSAQRLENSLLGPAFIKYLTNFRKKLETKSVPMLEISVMDAGPGYARRWTGKDLTELSVDEEKEAVISCFEKNGSSERIRAAGGGLTSVLSDLRRLNGWLRLRTGRTLIQRGFFGKEGDTRIGIKHVKECDAVAEGTVLSIVIPLIG